jgi:hypothetical protein
MRRTLVLISGILGSLMWAVPAHADEIQDLLDCLPHWPRC